MQCGAAADCRSWKFMLLHGPGWIAHCPCEAGSILFATHQHDAGRSVRSCARRGAQVRCIDAARRAWALHRAWRPQWPRNAPMHGWQRCKGPARGAFAPQTSRSTAPTSLPLPHPPLPSAACGPRAPPASSARRCARLWLPPRRRRHRPSRRPRRPSSSSSPSGVSAGSSVVRCACGGRLCIAHHQGPCLQRCSHLPPAGLRSRHRHAPLC